MKMYKVELIFYFVSLCLSRIALWHLSKSPKMKLVKDNGKHLVLLKIDKIFEIHN